MPASRRRSAARLAATVLLVLLVGGCAGKAATSTAASTPGTTTSTVAPTTSTVSPSRLTEEAWLTAVTKVHKRIDRPFTSSINMTRAKMVELGNTLGACSGELARIGSPSHRLQSVSVLVKKACRTYDQGAKCFATAAPDRCDSVERLKCLSRRARDSPPCGWGRARWPSCRCRRGRPPQAARPQAGLEVVEGSSHSAGRT